MDPRYVRAQRVIDIRDPSCPLPERVAIDANVLYFQYYPNLSDLPSAGLESPAPNRTRPYQAFLARLLKGGHQCCSTGFAFYEFARLVERVELGIEVVKRDIAGSFDLKTARSAVGDDLAELRARVGAYVKAALKATKLIAREEGAPDTFPRVMSQWERSRADLPDVLLLVEAGRGGVVDVLSDDVDLVTLDGIRLYTANKTSLVAARSAGRG